MKLQVIYTFEHGQEIANFYFASEIIETEESFVNFCKKALITKYAFSSMDEWRSKPEVNQVPKIVKLSGCIFTEMQPFDEEPEWWKLANGKVYFN